MLAVAAVLLLGALLGWTWHASVEPDAAAGVPASQTAPETVALRSAGDTAMPAPANVASSALPPMPTPSALAKGSLSATATGAPVWDLCGVGRLPVPPGAAAKLDPEQALAALPPHLGRDALVDGYLALFAALADGPPRWS